MLSVFYLILYKKQKKTTSFDQSTNPYPNTRNICIFYKVLPNSEEAAPYKTKLVIYIIIIIIIII